LLAVMRRYTTVLFDLDGTLIDSIGLIVDSFHHTMAAFDLPAQPDGVWLAGIGTPLRGCLAPYARDEAMLDALLDTYRTYSIDNHDARVRAYPGARESVHALVAAGVRLAVVTSKNRQGTARGLRAAGLTEVLEVLVCFEDVTRHKPHREPVDRAMALLGAEAGETLFVGDSLHDQHAGRAASVGTGAALWGPFAREELTVGEPSHWLTRPEDVVEVVLGR
jgi:pyrophosphatase PpaX